ncbi:hypothetical protein QFC21_002317 [Naganishia friedmannii]|uniref:Uncharacterized protein n=1 Tax=Naganishia friedmannii TaxID=89922 RepID=A0ACC2VWL9_9TREE|nr:hypothetical protein QFC21_002317 [Naganishia friedmannii]
MTALPRDSRYGFLQMAAPASYVAGLGRGASGFTTRSDIGPAREGPSAETVAEAREKRGDAPEEEEAFKDPDDESNLFAGTVYEADDAEADAIWESVDARMESRRKIRREAVEAEQLAKERALNPKLDARFADLKRGLTAVSDTEWENLPEVGDLTRKRRKQNLRLAENGSGKSYAISDTVLAGAAGQNQVMGELDEQQMTGGYETPMNGGAETDLVGIGHARETVLSLRLDQLSRDAANGTSTSIDPRGYMTALNSQIGHSDQQIGDIKRARQLLDSVIKTNPKHGPGWIAAASLEQHAKKMVAARKIIAQGCEQCPKNEDVWFHAADINTPENAKVILAKAVQHIPQSVKIWMKAASLETDVKARKRVLRKALEYIPNSVKLWKEVVNLEDDPEDARILLQRAVEVVPQSTELWLTLARLETPTEAQKVLNKAHKMIPTSHEIWIAGARLREQGGDAAVVDKLIDNAVSNLAKHQVIMTREQWIKEAERCETEGSPITAQAILKATLHLDVEEEDRMDTWLEDAESAAKRNFIECARGIYAYIIKAFPTKKAVWRAAADFEKQYGTSEALQELLAKAVQYCPRAEVLWLMAAKEKWLSGDIASAKDILTEAFEKNPDSESIWLAAAKLASETGQTEAAMQLLAKARKEADTDRIWMKSAMLERQIGKPDEALQTLEEAIKKFPSFDKLYMIKGQIHEERSEIPQAREAYAKGVKACPKSVLLWLLSSRLEEKAGITIKSRALLEKARMQNPKNDRLWAESIKVEERAGSAGQAKAMLARAQQDCPASGLLWSMAIWMEAAQQRKGRSVDAIKKSNEHPLVINAVGRLFWNERKIEKTRLWLSRAANADPDNGDLWAWWYKFEKQHGEKERQNEVINKCVAAEPHHGELWPTISKDIKNIGKSTTEILELVASQIK